MSKNKYTKSYWEGRSGLELKHMDEALTYAYWFKPKSVLDYGCGMGYRTHAFLTMDIPCYGFDISEYAVDNAYGLARGHVGTSIPRNKKFDLVLCYDVMEHIPEEDVHRVLSDVFSHAKRWVLFSVCFAGDPNGLLDPTHVTLKSRLWWESRLIDFPVKFHVVPSHFPFANQMILCEVVK